MAGKYLSLLVHFVWSTKNREPWIELAMREDMYAYIGGIMRKKKATLLAAGGMFDHIHLYASLPSIISIADLVNAVKANSSRWVHESFRNLRTFAWQEGYGAFSVSKSDEQRVIRYVQDQERHHAKRTFEEEFISLLEKHDMPYDPRQIWK
ncbi:MAG TPA: IS200/IS605 family transposase [Pyrinomonadaceae bacterium]|nr:IS200/IS605 family transposase [Pyrinomonadaceae bacterium]